MNTTTTEPVDVRSLVPLDSQGRERLWVPLETRSVDATGDAVKFSGYAAVFEQRAKIGGRFYEELAPSAFNNTLTRQDIFLLWNHDPSKPLARTGAGNLQLSTDKRGLKVDATFVNTGYARDAAELIRSGVSTKMSFGFTVPDGGEVITRADDGLPLRRLVDTRLWEASIVGTWPAYDDTAASLRGDAFGILCRSLGMSEADVLEHVGSHTLDAAIAAMTPDMIQPLSASQRAEPGAVTTSEDATRAVQTVKPGTNTRLWAARLSAQGSRFSLPRIKTNGAPPGQASG